jgi:hypothetical protein
MGAPLPAMSLGLGMFGFAAHAWPYTPESFLTAPSAQAAISEVLAAPAFSQSFSASTLLAVLGSMAGLAALALMVRVYGGYWPLNKPPVFSALQAREVDTQALQHAQALWPHAPLQAVERLYVGLLARLQSDYQLRIDSADTEADILAQVAKLQLSGLEDFSQRLTFYCLQARYAGDAPTAPAWVSLCEGWRHLFPADDVA